MLEKPVKPDLKSVLERYPSAQTYRPGDGEKLNRLIIDLMRAGRKTATCAVPDEFADDPDSCPVVGRIDIALDWNSDPALATRTLSLETISYAQMDESRIPAQGEFEDLEDWRRGYRAYYQRQGSFDPEMIFIYERFEVVEDFAAEEPT
ncbi:ASCH domain-containing protein [Hoeflea alexandrii]|uniref:ASCH domain-containing protein n=1 Tax=Hoeflea alexandrii TaxID=288436 RepID=A0ABT1CPU1_9HYPH|nr:ASCH domain-containing protein [Hoeflea alexandrii]